MRGTAFHDRFVLAVAALFVCLHLAWLPRHLEDIDSINFALGLRHYDVAAHQPHPPGYPVFIALGRACAAIVSPFAPDLASRDAIAMAVLAGLSGACVLLVLYRILRDLRDEPDASNTTSPAVVITTLVTATPLFWVTASRPLSDMPGLAGALTCQWLLLRAARPEASWRGAAMAALGCGVASGLRSQVTWLVVPLLAWVLLRVRRRDDLRTALGVAAAAFVGVLSWAVPMVVLVGGIGAYRAALTSQAGQDFEGVPMLVLQPGLRRLAQALADTFVSGWSWWPLSAAMLVLAAAGVPALRRRATLATWLGLGYGPYLVYHLLFHETETTRYALPLVVPVATLVVVGLARWTPRVAVPAALVACGIALGVSLHAHRQYVGAGANVSEVMGRMESEARQSTVRPQVLMHRRVWAETRRARATLVPNPAFDVLPSPRMQEWQGAVAAWRAGKVPIWWLVDPRRGDRAAIDPRALHVREHVMWPMPVAPLLGGMRPHAFDWYDVTAPQWVLIDGWGLTPELAGIAAAGQKGPSTTGATAVVRGQAGVCTLVIGGRYLAPPAEAPAPTLAVRIGETDLPPVTLSPGAFAHTWTLPAGTIGPTGYAPLTVRATTTPAGAANERVFLEQFDVQPAGVPVIALEAGWYEPERDVATGRQWRWVGDESRVRIAGASGDVRLVIAGTYPRHYERAPVLEIIASGQRIASLTLTRPFAVEQRITAQQLGAEGRLKWRVSPSFVAGERTGSADARRLAIEITTLRADAIR
ncbi:hypothetical protein LuPra_00653 [Luteitalea pratensis]|uniref:Glycosyltransferase RgtA/B/C/D-like domain-containing protein n=2 Tax=Luteitalea pratensis TaxID=1855912 RepID=A0A143PGS8_LUTPR|nr:hypothetical protein LuPra_00653 [Luteitalea pratensis]